MTLYMAVSQIQDIRRANNLWSSESIQSRLVLKIPFGNGESSSRNHSPKLKHSPKLQPKHSPTAVRRNGTGSRTWDESDEEVRSKPRGSFVSSSEGSSGSSDGVKSIADILNSADRQLKLSREFADKMAVRRSVQLL